MPDLVLLPMVNLPLVFNNWLNSHFLAVKDERYFSN